MNWTRAELKSQAKVVLKKHYLKLLLVSLVLLIAGAGSGINSRSGSNNSKNVLSNLITNKSYSDSFTRTKNYVKSHNISVTRDIDISFDDGVSLNLSGRRYSLTSPSYYGVSAILQSVLKLAVSIVVALVIFAVIFIFSFVVKIFILFPLEVGGRKTIINTDADNPPNLSLIKTPFTGGYYPNMVKTGFLMNIKILLGTLMFIIPGIIRSYEYTFVPYILADNPGIDSKHALDISKRMTYGHKFNIFKLQLSFIGWNILATMLLSGLGNILVLPYVNTTMAQLYLKLRDNAASVETTGHTDFNEDPIDMRGNMQ